MVQLDKEGPIYDFCWSPTSRNFTVCYGYMPARVQMFDLKTKPLHSFGSQHRNFLLYQPQGKLLLSAGFGNLAGGIDIWDVSTRNKVAEFTAANSSHCEWSPCGQYILTATLSPRLRVDNGVKLWWCGGQLLHIHPQDELYQVCFKPSLLKDIPSFPGTLPKPPLPNESVALYRPKGENGEGAVSKPAGAYRPPGARGTVASDAYKRTDGDTPSGASTPPMFRGGKPAQRYVPGAPIPGAAVPSEETKKKRTRKKKVDKDGAGEANGGVSPADVPTEGMAKVDIGDGNPAETADGDDAAAKRIRNLIKKLKNIEDLKIRLANGESLEKTQVRKIDTEGAVRAEIESLGGVAP